MRLSVVLCFKKTVNGYIFGGKHRLVKEVKYKAMEHLRQDMERQDKIMKLLRYPYLTKVGSLPLFIFIFAWAFVCILISGRIQMQSNALD